MVWSEETGDFVIGRVLASVDGEGNSLATVLNLSDEPLKLKKGLEIASCARLETFYLSHEEDQSHDGGKGKANLCSDSYSSSIQTVTFCKTSLSSRQTG